MHRRGFRGKSGIIRANLTGARVDCTRTEPEAFALPLHTPVTDDNQEREVSLHHRRFEDLSKQIEAFQEVLAARHQEWTPEGCKCATVVCENGDPQLSDSGRKKCSQSQMLTSKLAGFLADKDGKLKLGFLRKSKGDWDHDDGCWEYEDVGGRVVCVNKTERATPDRVCCCVAAMERRGYRFVGVLAQRGTLGHSESTHPVTRKISEFILALESLPNGSE